MPGLNLTRDEAIERATVIKRVHTYRIELDLPSDKDVFTCKPRSVLTRYPAHQRSLTLSPARCVRLN